VQSSVIRLNISPKLASLKVPEDSFIEFLKLSFGQKRKTLWNNLKLSYQPEVLKVALQKTGIKPTVRAEALTLEKSAALFRALSSSPPATPSKAP
jgi:16S rRNA (adenine1518-N6/adenine1519-N6)-dimethyltransferase